MMESKGARGDEVRLLVDPMAVRFFIKFAASSASLPEMTLITVNLILKNCTSSGLHSGEVDSQTFRLLLS